MCIECNNCGRARDFTFRKREFTFKVSKLNGGQEYVTHGWKVVKLFEKKEFKESLVWICPSCRVGVLERDERERDALMALSKGKCPVHHSTLLEIQGDVGLCPFCFEGAYMVDDEGVSS